MLRLSSYSKGQSLEMSLTTDRQKDATQHITLNQVMQVRTSECVGFNVPLDT